VLAVLAAPGAARTLRELARAEVTRSCPERRPPAAGHGCAASRLLRLERVGAVSRSLDPSGEDPRFGLTDRGWELLGVAERAARWEERAGWSARDREPGHAALATLSRPYTFAIMCQLADGSLDAAELLERVGAARRGERHVAARRVQEMQGRGLLASADPPSSTPLSLTDSARGLAAIVLLALWCERGSLAHRPASTVDLLGPMRVLVPLVGLPADLAGTFLLYQSLARRPECSLCLRASGGSLTPLASIPTSGLGGFAIAAPGAWLRTLVTGQTSGIAAAGDLDALAVVISALGSPARLGHGVPDRVA